MKWLQFLIPGFIFIFGASADAFKNRSYGLGVGYYSQNFFGVTSQSQTGGAGFMGEPNYPLLLKYDHALTNYWFIAPQLGYTLFPRNTQGSTAKVTLLHLSFLFGANFQGPGATWDWYFGPGFLQQDIKGKGGTTQMNNGTGTATFALPGRTSTLRKVTFNLGTSWLFDQSRLGVEITVENLFSSSKRTQSIMLSYSYLFSGGGRR